MQHILVILLHLSSSLGRLLRSGGTKALVAENLLLKHQLLILRRSRRRAPNLRSSDRRSFEHVVTLLLVHTLPEQESDHAMEAGVHRNLDGRGLGRIRVEGALAIGNPF